MSLKLSAYLPIFLTLFFAVAVITELRTLSSSGITHSDNAGPPVINKTLDKLALTRLFGQSVDNNNVLPNTQVIGIFASNNPALSQVLLLNGQSERVYHIGQQTQEGIVIKEILPFAVVLEYNGETYRLTLPKMQ